MGYIYNEELGYRLEKEKEKNHQIKKKYTGRVWEKENEEEYPEWSVD